MKLIIANIALCYMFLACNNEQASKQNVTTTEETKGSQPDKLNAIAGWLIGTWAGTMKDGEIYEHWEKADDSTYSGTGFFLKGSDTLSKEQIKLVLRADTVYYIPTVANQNNSLPVSFTMVQGDDRRLVFENKLHDFPQLITYTLISNDSMVASISGNVKGRERMESFPMRRKIM